MAGIVKKLTQAHARGTILEALPGDQQLLNQLRRLKQRLSGVNPAYAREPWRDPARREQIIRDFHGLYYDSFRDGKTWADTWFLGTKTEKCPIDLWLYQELIHKLRPDCIIETGTRFGGSALYMASICDLIGHGSILTIDIDGEPVRPTHPRLTYLTESSVGDIALAKARELTAKAQTVLVVLDSDHSYAHVLEELKHYSDLVTVGSFLIVEDTNINGNPVIPSFGPGPMEAVDEFLKQDTRYEIDPFNEKMLLSFSPRGFLRRTK